MSKEIGEQHSSFGIGIMAPEAVTYTADGPQVKGVIVATDPASADRAYRVAQEHFAQPEVMEQTLSGSGGKPNSSSHAMPGRNWNASWQPTGPRPKDLSWMQPKNTGNPKQS